MVTPRPGRSMLGCLFTLLLVVAAVYVGMNIGEPYFRNYQFKDSMAQQARFGGQLSDAEIQSRLRLRADTLGLPSEAGRVRITRTQRSITIASEYAVVVQLPLYTRHITFSPRVEAPL